MICKSNNNIPVVFATNNNFALYTGVAIKSLLMHCNPNKIYNIYVLHNNLSSENSKILEALHQKNAVIECINVNEYIRGVADFKSIHLTQETVYRLLIPEILYEFEKVIYLDSDIIIKDDVAKLFDIDIGNNILGVVREVCSDAMKKYYLNQQENIVVEEAFNAGVLLIDTKEFINNKVKEVCINLLEKDFLRKNPKYTYLDQDVLNIVCKNKVYFLDNKWNFQTMYLFAGMHEQLSEKYKDIYFSLVNDAKILHFAGKNKPWQIPYLTLAQEFWDIAKKTEFYDEIVSAKEKYRLQQFSTPPFSNIERNSKVILYGAGGKGKLLREMLVHEKYCEILLWVDKNAEEKNVDYIIHSPSEICNYEYEYILIAIENKSVADSAKNELILLGACPEKIIWLYK